MDWNDFGIDERRFSSVVYGAPQDWFASHGWRVFGTESGMEWGPMSQTLLAMVMSDNPAQAPSVAWFKTRKGRGYLKYDNASHGAPHPMNSALVLGHQAGFCRQIRGEFTNFGGSAPQDPAALQAEFSANLQAMFDVMAA